MGYQTLNFLLFSAAWILIYNAFCGTNIKARKYVLLAANLCFYAIAGSTYIPYITATLLCTFASARGMSYVYAKRDRLLSVSEKDSAVKKGINSLAAKRAKLTMLAGILIPLILLCVCKYSGFVISNIDALLGVLKLPEIPIFKTVLPLGISFYTFMAVSYVLDVYWERYEAERNFVSYAAFLTYFPHIVQGPIDRYNEFKQQLDTKAAVSTIELKFGAELIIWGFFKKLVIADRLSLFVSEIFDNPDEYTGIIVAIAAVFYSIQIYADFSGCIDIVTGVSEMMGIKLKKNFNHPYFSQNIPEFWRRWHISLGEWFKDYIYYPVSISAFVKDRKKKLKKSGKKKQADIFASSVPTAVVWLITGIWHGASWNYVMWGAYYCIIMVLGIVLKDKFEELNRVLKINTECFSFRLWRMLRTFILCTIGRIFFRADGISNALKIFASLFGGIGWENVLDGEIYNFGLDSKNLLLVVFCMLILLTADILEEKIKLREALEKQNIVFRWTIIIVGIVAVVVFGIYGTGFDSGAFIYEKF